MWPRIQYSSLLLVVALCYCCSAREANTTFEVSPGGMGYFEKFGFYDGGTAKLYINTTTDQPIILYSCNKMASRTLYRDYYLQTACTNPDIIPGCVQTKVELSATQQFTIDTVHAEMIYFGVINCQPFEVDCFVNYEFVNPGGQQLSSEYVPLANFYIVLITQWLPLTIYWICNWVIHRRQKNKLHKLITVYPIAKLVWISYNALLWNLASVFPVVEQQMVETYQLLQLITLSLLITVFLLIARGWGLIDDPLRFDGLIIAGTIILLVASKLIGIVFEGISQLMALASYCIIVLLLFAFVNKTQIRLQALENDPDLDDVGVHLRGIGVYERKVRMLNRFNRVMIFYCVAQAVIVVLAVLVFYDIVWVTVVMSEMTDLIAFIFIALTFYLRKDNIYYRLEGAGGSLEKTPIKENIKLPTWAVVEKQEEVGRTNPYNNELVPGAAGSCVINP